jgi:sec-independent protein translocase protein TatA
MGLDNPIHILFLLILLLLVFGAKRLPEMGRSLGTGLRGFRDSLNGAGAHGSDVSHAVQAAPAVQPVAATAEAPTVPAAVARTVNSEHPDLAA